MITVSLRPGTLMALWVQKHMLDHCPGGGSAFAQAAIYPLQPPEHHSSFTILKSQD